jgi:uncharacterized SAM-binding protein YcdF (DUF218 family)
METPERSLDRDFGRNRASASPSVGDSGGTIIKARRVPGAGTVVGGLLLLMVLAIAGWFIWVFGQIRYYATHDDARAADAIAVFGAAEYDGRPSPVLRARLDHALALYRRGLAPMIITLGGQGDAYHSEGSVGRDYLMSQGVPESSIIAETQSNNTEASAEQLSIIAGSNNIQSIIAVSDATHLFRIRAMCERSGLRIFTSPRANGRAIARSSRVGRIAHELLSYTLWRVGL